MARSAESGVIPMGRNRVASCRGRWAWVIAPPLTVKAAKMYSKGKVTETSSRAVQVKIYLMVANTKTQSMVAVE